MVEDAPELTSGDRAEAPDAEDPFDDLEHRCDRDGVVMRPEGYTDALQEASQASPSSEDFRLAGRHGRGTRATTREAP